MILETGEVRQLFDENAYAPRYVPTGHIVFGHGPTRELMAVRFDLSQLEIVGRTAGPARSSLRDGTGGATDYAVSETGALIYTPHRNLAATLLVPSLATPPESTFG